MSERYSKLFALSENLYASGSPVVIAAGALLKDNQTGKVIAQLKLRNISKKAIKAVKVCISPLDTVGKPLGGAVQYQYLDLNAKRDEDFGQKAAIALSNAATRSFVAVVEEIAFTDNSVWTATGEPWKMLPQPQPIGLIHGVELEKQFRIKYGSDCKNLLLPERDLWFCVCGALNHDSETECHTCRRNHAMLNSVDYDELNREKNARLAEEREKAEQEAVAAKARAEEARKQAEKNKRRAKKIGIVVTVAAIIAVATFFVTTKIIIPSNNYKEAEEMLAKGDYDGAIAGFTALVDYKDSSDRIIEAEAAKQDAINAEAYLAAKELLTNKEYAHAIEAFEALGNYKDSTEMVCESIYLYANEMMYQQNYAEAYSLFQEITQYKDSTEHLKSFYFLPVSIVVETSGKNDYRFSYDENGKIVHAACYIAKTGEEHSNYSFNEDGKVIRENWSGGRVGFTYIHNDDETVTRINYNNEVDFTYDQYGNTISFQNSDGNVNVYTDKTYDEYHNPSTVKSNRNYRENTYSDDGLLLSVYTRVNNLIAQSEVSYQCFYEPNAVIDYELIWKNIRIICGSAVW